MREPISHGDSILANSRPHFDECWYWYNMCGFLVLTHCGPVTQICVFTLQLCKTD